MIETGSLIIVNCMNPKEKLWGELLRLDAVGVVLRGLDLNSVEDWLRQVRADDDEGFVTPSTVFVPLHRVERLYLDESGPSAECFADRYAAATDGADVRDALRAIPSPGASQG